VTKQRRLSKESIAKLAGQQESNVLTASFQSLMGAQATSLNDICLTNQLIHAQFKQSLSIFFLQFMSIKKLKAAQILSTTPPVVKLMDHGKVWHYRKKKQKSLKTDIIVQNMQIV
jgi:hypothetical protein